MNGKNWLTNINPSPKLNGTKWLLKTGNTDYTRRKNIYDLVGNITEWTSEIYNSSRTVRGGNFKDGESILSWSASQRYVGHGKEEKKLLNLGFRVALYIQ